MKAASGARRDRLGMPASALLVGVLGVALALTAGISAARGAGETVVIGGDGPPDVVVNYGAIDEALGLAKKETAGMAASKPKPAARKKPTPAEPTAPAPEPGPVAEAAPPLAPAPAKESTEAMAAAEAEAEAAPKPPPAKAEPAPAPASTAGAPEPAEEPPSEEPAAVPEPPPTPEAAEAPPPDAPAAPEAEAAAPTSEPKAPAEAAGAPAEPPKVAAVEPAEPVSVASDAIRIPFAPENADLPRSAVQPLGELAARLSRDPDLRLQLLAYAAGTKETASQSRRLSLNRALAVRGALIDAGVRSTRIDVRALGSQTEESPVDRVDVRVIRRGG